MSYDAGNIDHVNYIQHTPLHAQVVGVAASNETSLDKKKQNLVFAIKNGCVKKAKEIMASMSRFDLGFIMDHSSGKTALMFAAEYNQPEIVIALLELRVPFGIVFGTHQTALMFAASGGNRTIVLKLIKNGSSIDSSDSKGRTALMYAAEKDRVDAIKMMVMLIKETAWLKVRKSGLGKEYVNLVQKNEVKKRLNTTDSSGSTALMIAASNGYINTVKLLINEGADVNKTDSHDQTASMLAASNGHTEIADLLRSSENSE